MWSSRDSVSVAFKSLLSLALIAYCYINGSLVPSPSPYAVHVLCVIIAAVNILKRGRLRGADCSKTQ